MTLELAVEILIKSSLLLGLGLAIRAFIKQNNPSLRHLILFTTVIGCLAIPIAIPLVKYQTKIPVPHQFDLGIDQSVSSQNSATASAQPQAPIAVQTNSSTSWPGLAFVIWFTGFFFVLARYGFGLASLANLKNQKSTPALDLADGFNVPQDQLRICTSPLPKTAMTWGVLRPTILLPLDSTNWTSNRMEMILLHELAHVRRKDFVSQLLTEFVCAIYWFNPLVWHSAHAMREDAELAADDAVIQTGIRPTDYATELLQLAANLSQRNLVLNRVGISTMTNSKIESRLTAILSSSAKARGITTVTVLSALALSGVAVTTVASLKLRQEGTPAQLKAESMSRLKQIALGTYMYSQDFDNLLPNPTSTKEVKRILSPYMKNDSVFKSPRLGAEFLYNPNMSAVDITRLKSPAETVLWYEVVPKGLDPHAAFVDGHVTTITAQNVKAFERALKQKYPKGGGTPLNGVGGR